MAKTYERKKCGATFASSKGAAAHSTRAHPGPKPNILIHER